ncbi:MAG: S8 family serine peptidase [Thermoanaerobaculia bacterium]
MPLLVVLLALTRSLPQSAPAGIDSRIFAGKAAGEPASFLVVLSDQADLSGAAAIPDRTDRRRFVYETLRDHAEASQAPLRQRLRAAGVRFRPHFLVNLIEVEGERGLALELALRDDVAFLAANRGAPLRRPASSPVSSPLAAAAAEPNIQKIRAPELWSRGFTGQGVVVGIADAGVDWTHPALQSQYRGWNGSTAVHDYNWHDAIHDPLPGNPCGSNAPEPCDDDGHGTSVAGLTVGDDGAGNAIGVAPGARWIGCRNMDRGSGTPARYTECFEWFLAPTDAGGGDPRPDLGADVINNSWTCPESEGCTDPNILRSVVENVRAAGVAVVLAAGNDGATCSTITEVPAIYEAGFSVGATDAADQIAGFSSLGPVTVDGSNRLKPDLTAPGVNVRSASLSAGYKTNFSGTSAAAPHVAGAIALLWSAVPGRVGDVDGTELALEAGAVPLTLDLPCDEFSGLVVPNHIFGWGRLDVAGAYAQFLPPRLPRVLADGRPDPRVVPPRP